MSDTYIGWDGKSYPWPPPEGWYHASDDRWWAPGTGPNPPPAGGLLMTASEAPAAASPEFTQRTAPYSDASDPPGGYGGPALDPSPGFAPGQLGGYPPPDRSGPGTFGQPGTYGDTEAGLGPGPGRSDTRAMPQLDTGLSPAGPGGYDSPTPESPGFGPPPAGYAGPGPAAPARGGLPLPALIAGVVAVVIVGVGAYLLLARGGGDDTATDSSTPTTPTTAADGSTLTTAPADPTATTAATVGTDTSVPGDTTASTPPGDTGSTTAPAGTDLVATFRGMLTENGLTSDELTESEIEAFGTNFCIFATESETAEEFDAFRQQAINEATSSLDAESLGLVIDTALVVFCPEDAARLGIVA